MRAKFGTKVALILGLSMIGVSGFTIFNIYRHAVGAIRREVRTKLTDVAVSTSYLVDPVVHARIKSPKDENRRHYNMVRRRFRSFLQTSPQIRHLYTLVRTEDQKTLKFVVDAGTDPPLIAHVGYAWNVADHQAALEAFTKPAAEMRVRHDKWGQWLAGYAPIRDATGKTVAIIGVDMSVAEALKEENNLRYIALLTFLISTILAIIMAALVARKISRPIQQLTTATRHIAEGNLDCTIAVNVKDELGQLAASFNGMAASLRESQNVLMQRANTDGLTGLYNHRYFQERLHQELKRAVRYGHPLSLLMIDLNGFKAINDNLGHPAGDTILRNVAKVINSLVREIDITARYGGDEFTVILPETDIDEAKTIAERIRDAVNKKNEAALDSTEHGGKDPDVLSSQYKVALSIGIATCPRHAKQRDALVAAADISMYRAKHSSPDKICVYDEVPGAGGSMDPCRIQAFLQSASVSTIAALAAAVDAKDHYTRGHSEAVARYATAIASEMGLSDEDKFNVRIAALLHDVGKIGTPDSILKTPGSLSTQEREIVRSHPSVGENIVKQVPQLQKILPGIVYHHERYDGHGYPCGLQGIRIPLIARIICVADAFDAMTSSRPYRNALSVREALSELRKHSGAQFDPNVVESLMRWLETVDITRQEAA